MNRIDETGQDKCTCVNMDFPCPRHHDITPDCTCDVSFAPCPWHDT